MGSDVRKHVLLFACVKRFNAIALLLAHILERFQPIDPGAQLAQLYRRWFPQTRAHRDTETCEQCRIRPIGLVARQFTLREAFDARGIDHAHLPARLNQCHGNGFAIRPGCFQANMGLRLHGPAVDQPL